MMKRGRPKSENPKSSYITVRFTDKEWEAIKRASKKYGISTSEIMRRGLDLICTQFENGEIDAKGMRELLNELNKE